MRSHSIFHDKKIYLKTCLLATTSIAARGSLSPLEGIKEGGTGGEQHPPFGWVALPPCCLVAKLQLQFERQQPQPITTKLLALSTTDSAVLPPTLCVFKAKHVDDFGIVTNWGSNGNLFEKRFAFRNKKSLKANNRVSLVFTSLEVENLDIAIGLFQKYLANFTNKLLNSHYLDIKSLPFAFNFEISKLAVNKYKGSVQSKGKNDKLLKQQTYYKIPLRRPCNINYKLQTGILKAVRNYARRRLTNVPLKAQIYTVIRSPHVFKKTREQFATQRYKRLIKLDFTDAAALRLLTDTLVLLKLPAEIKVITHKT